jgi:hypothetical protein
LGQFVQNVLHDRSRGIEVKLKHLRALHEEVEGKVATKRIEAGPPHARYTAPLDTEWRSHDSSLAGFTLSEHICAKFGARMASDAATQATLVAAGRHRLIGPLKLFIFRHLMSINTDDTEAAEDLDQQARYPLYFRMWDPVGGATDEFPWEKGSELSDQEGMVIEEMLPACVELRHAYRLLLELQANDKHARHMAAQSSSIGVAAAPNPRKPPSGGRGGRKLK